jgi:20S proteasome alpha/beta subunit
VTLVVAFVADDRAVMAADSQATEADGTRTTIEKIWRERNLLFGYAGPQAMRDKLEETIAFRLASASDAELANHDKVETMICAVAKIVMEGMYANYVSDIGERPKSRLGGQLLIIGCDSKRHHWLLEIDADNTPTYYTKPGFHAAGSGSPAAQVAVALLENYVPSDLTVRELQAIAYRAVKTSIRVLAQYVGEPVQLWSCDGEGGFHRATDTEVTETEKLVGAWVAQERDSLLDVSRPGGAKPPLPGPISAGEDQSKGD